MRFISLYGKYYRNPYNLWKPRRDGVKTTKGEGREKEAPPGCMGKSKEVKW